MKTIEEIRHDWLLRLVEKHGTVANLNAALGRTRTDATLTQIKNKAPNTRSGKVRSMGSDLAREIEERLGIERGTLDHEPKEGLPVEGSHASPAQTDDEQWFLEKWRNAREEAQEVARFVLSRSASHTHGWVDSDARAYVDSLQLKARDWQETNKNRNVMKNQREKPVPKAISPTTKRPIERPSEQKFLQTRIASSA